MRCESHLIYMGSGCCKQKRQTRGAYAKLRPYESNDMLQEHVAERTVVEPLIEDQHCLICLETTLADTDTYAEWEHKGLTATQALEAPDGIYGTVCACDPTKSLRHLACLKRQLDSLATDPDRRRTCGLCNTQWVVIKTAHPKVPLELIDAEDRDAELPAWRWKDIQAGNYWVRIQAVASEPSRIDSDLPDAYSSVQVEIYSPSAGAIDPNLAFSSVWWSRVFNHQGIGERVKWSTVRLLLRDLERI